MEFTPKEILTNDNTIRCKISGEFECQSIPDLNSNAIQCITFSKVWKPDNTEWIDFCKCCIENGIDNFIIKDEYVLFIDETCYDKIEYYVVQSCGEIYIETLRLMKDGGHNE